MTRVDASPITLGTTQGAAAFDIDLELPLDCYVIDVEALEDAGLDIDDSADRANAVDGSNAVDFEVDVDVDATETDTADPASPDEARQAQQAAFGAESELRTRDFWAEVVALHHTLSTDPHWQDTALHTAIVWVASGLSQGVLAESEHIEPALEIPGVDGPIRTPAEREHFLQEVRRLGSAALVVAYEQRGSALRSAGGGRG
jgi:hypothetical protein